MESMPGMLGSRGIPTEGASWAVSVDDATWNICEIFHLRVSVLISLVDLAAQLLLTYRSRGTVSSFALSKRPRSSSKPGCAAVTIWHPDLSACNQVAQMPSLN